MVKNIKEFADYVYEAVRNILDESYSVEILHDRRYEGGYTLAITTSDNREAGISMEAFYKDHTQNMAAFDDVVSNILHEAEKYLNRIKMEDVIRHNYALAKEKIIGCLINTDKNRELLKIIAHREYMDLSLVYIVEVRDGADGYGIRVTENMLREWGISESRLFLQMKDNLKKMKTVVNSLGNILGIGAAEPIYVAFNADFRYGSVQMLNEDTLNKVSTKLGGSFYILPSSINELIFTAYNSAECESDPIKLAEMVRDVNLTVVPEDEILSDHVYFYDHETENITIAA